MMIFKKAIPRRTFLRGVGATLALPLLDAMMPAFQSPAKSPVRLGILYTPNGMWPMNKWTPDTVGAGFQLSPTLEPLAPYRNQMLVLSGLCDGFVDHDAGGGHTWAVTSYLSGVTPKRTTGKDLRVGTTMDQIAAQELVKHTQLGSLEVSLIPSPIAGSCEPGYSCAYIGALSWRNPDTPLPMESNPRGVFERLFGDSDSTSGAVRRARMKEDQSILDWVSEDVARFVKKLGPGDRAKMDQYLDAIRDVERRIQTTEEQSSRELPSLERPTGIPGTLSEYSKLIFDLQVLAYQADLTRVITLMVGRDGPYGSRPYPEIGIADTHHTLSHHQDDPEKVEKLFQINNYHVKLFAYYLDRLRSTPDGDGNLLDHCALLYGAGMSNGNGHIKTDLPALLIGGAGGQLKGGRHIQCARETPMANLHLTILEMLGVRTEKLGDSTGKLDLSAG